MDKAVYCLTSNEPQASEILTHLRNLGFDSSEISVLLKDKDTRNISVKEKRDSRSRKGRTGRRRPRGISRINGAYGSSARAAGCGWSDRICARRRGGRRRSRRACLAAAAR
jgi:hypothetical protein